jgi:SulP family sulfate permease
MTDGASGRGGGGPVRDVVAGLTTGIANMPDAMASALLAGVSPITGLYALMVGTPIAGLLTSSVFLNASATSAMALAMGSALASTPAGPERDAALASLTLAIGVILVVAGILKAGRLLRFVSNAVMIGFLTGVSILIVLSQLGDLTGFDSEASNKVVAAIDLLLHLGEVIPTVLATGLLSIAVILIADRTRLRSFSMLIGILAGSTAAALLGWDDVPTVADIATIPTSLPLPALPTLPSLDLWLSAAAVALIAMVQSAGVSRGYRNPDGRFGDPSRDFAGVGAGNVAAGLVGGLAIGGSVGGTALNVSAGARSRLANVVSGLVVVAAILLLAGVVGRLALPSMAALLIVAGVQSIKVPAIVDVWEVGPFPRAVMLATAGLTLALPVQQAVLVGVVLSALATVVQASADVRVVALVPGSGVAGSVGWAEAPVPDRLPDRAVTVVQILGSLSFAAADRVLELLPDPSGSHDAVVVIRLRQHVRLSSTLMVVLERYRDRVDRAGGHLLLAGVGPDAATQLAAAETLMPGLTAADIFPATADYGPATAAAAAAGRAWIAERETGAHR